MPNTQITLYALPSIPDVKPGDNIGQLIVKACQQAGQALQSGDILAISSKIVSKAENRFVNLASIVPSADAEQLAQVTRKDPRVVELVLQNSTEISRTAPHVLIVRHKLGFISANAGIDASNIAPENDSTVLLLPQAPDESAEALRHALQAHYKARLGVIICDTHGRPHRLGNIGVAIGLAGVPALIDQRGELDLYGNTLHATITPLADELAAAAGLISGQADEGQPIVLIRGVDWQPEQATAGDLLRPPEMDLYK